MGESEGPSATDKLYQPNRRELLGATAGVAALGCGPRAGSSIEEDPPSSADRAPEIEALLADNIYTRLLGVRPHLGAHEHVSRLGGSRMPEQVVAAMAEANDYLVDMHALSLAAGRRVAELIGADDAIVTAGGYSAMTLGAAACLTGTDPERIEALPAVRWRRRECLLPPGHRFEYDRAYRDAGMQLVEAGDRAEMLQRLGDATAMVAVLALTEKQVTFAPPVPVAWGEAPAASTILPAEAIAIAGKRGVPVLVDMASDLPPPSNLSRFLDLGADLVVVSGGKAIGGPQSTGILAGRSDLLAAARLNHAPNTAIGRGMKVGKEEIVGLVVALERYLALDHEAEIARWNTKARWLADALGGVPGLEARFSRNTMGYADVELLWDPERLSLSADELKTRLREGNPPVEYDLTVRTRLLRDGEEVLVARRIREVFESAGA
ncbi:MAG: hypothetical protein VYE73_07880 [Acidobacteriota bacterium]|nr:hypothetical protein [Acidobacteriota bacterium]